MCTYNHRPAVGYFVENTRSVGCMARISLFGVTKVAVAADRDG